MRACPRSCSSAPSGATRARARRPTCSGSRVDAVVKFNGGNNAGHTIVIGSGESGEVRPAPAAVRHPDARLHAGHRQRRRRSTSSVLFEEIDGAAGPRRRHLASWWSAPPRTSSRRTTAPSTRSPSACRQLQIGTTGRGIGPTYADKMSRVGIRVQDLFDETSCAPEGRRGARAEEPGAGEGLQPQGGSTSTPSSTSCSSYADRLRPMVADTALLLEQMLDDGRTVVLEARPGDDARRRPRHLSVRHVLQRDGGRRVHRLRHPADPDQPRDRRRQGVHDPRRRGTVPDRAARRERRAAARRRRRVRHHDRPAAPLRLVRRGDRAAMRRGSTASPTSSSPSSTC